MKEVRDSDPFLYFKEGLKVKIPEKMYIHILGSLN
jgi:hypothetical protein